MKDGGDLGGRGKDDEKGIIDRVPGGRDRGLRNSREEEPKEELAEAAKEPSGSKLSSAKEAGTSKTSGTILKNSLGKDSINPKTGKVVIVNSKVKKKKAPYVPSDGVRAVGNFLMMVKRASFNYNENLGTTLPGFMDQSQYVGINAQTSQPGLPFAFGYQPDRLWLEGKGNDNVMTRDSLFNAPFQQQYAQTFNLTANVEPFKDFRIDLSMTKTFNKAHSELFKDTLGGGSDYVHLNPYETGGFSISYIAINTLFQKKDGVTNLSKAFSDFENNRKIISNRLGAINPYTGGLAAPEDKEFAKGYTRYSQDVLIPAFLAAYSGKDAKTYPLLNNENDNVRSNPFKNILPLPNWRLNYSGLAKTKMFKDIFQSFTLNHAYTGTLSMNSFTSALMYRDVYALGFPSFIDSVSHNYVPYFLVPNMTINENFGPLIGVDMTFKNSLNIHFEFKKSRVLSMSLIDFQLSETKSSDFTIGGGMRIKNVTIPTPYFGLNRRKSDVNIKADFGLRDDYTTINRLDQRESRATRGQKVITITPSIDYLLTDNVTLRLFYDRRQSIPYVSNAYPITTTRGGITIRFMLGQ